MICIDRAITLKPSAALYHVNRASALLALGRLDAAEDACRKALQLKRNCAEAYQVLGHIVSDLGRPGEAIAAYNEALGLKPDLPDLHDNLGLALRQAGRLRRRQRLYVRQYGERRTTPRRKATWPAS